MARDEVGFFAGVLLDIIERLRGTIDANQFPRIAIIGLVLTQTLAGLDDIVRYGEGFGLGECGPRPSKRKGTYSPAPCSKVGKTSCAVIIWAEVFGESFPCQ